MSEETSSNTRLILLLILALASTAMAVKYRLERDDMEDQLKQIDGALQSTETGLSGRNLPDGEDKGGAGRVFKLLALLEEKDVDIRQLKQGGRTARDPIARPQAGTAPQVERPADRQPEPSFASIAVGLGEQLESLGQVDTSALGQAELREHVELREAIIAMRDVFAQLQINNESLASEDTRSAITAGLKRLAFLLKRERETIYRNTGRSFGYDAGGAQEFAGFMNLVNDMTSTRWVDTALRATGAGD